MYPVQKDSLRWYRRFWIIVAVLVAIFLSRVIFGKITEWRALNNQERLRTASEESSEKELMAKVALLQDSGALGQHIASSKVDVCYIRSDDQGWMAVNYSQHCYLMYVEGFTTPLSKEAIEKFNSPRTPGLFIKDPIAIKFRPGDCSEDEISSWRRGCEKPGRLSYTGDPGAVVKDYKNFIATSTNSSENQVWIVLQSNYYSENLGCARFPLVFFCESPRRHPIQAP